MPALVAFASLPFGLKDGMHEISTPMGAVDVHISELRYSRFLTITSRPELAQSIPERGEGGGFTTYTWYDHPFVLRVVFGRNVAALGSINSCATVVRPLSDDIDMDDEQALSPVRKEFSALALAALNNLIAVVRRKARLYHVFDLRRDDIEITIRSEHDGTVLRDDPLQAMLVREEVAETDRFDLLQEGPEWYRDLSDALRQEEPVTLAEDLLIEAERALAQRFPRQAIATCHTAMEAAVSALLTRGMHRQDMSNREIDHVLSTRSVTSKLDVLLRRYTGFSLKHHNHELWKCFNELNDLRNDIVHRGGFPPSEVAQSAIHTTRQLLSWLDMVRQLNKWSR